MPEGIIPNLNAFAEPLATQYGLSAAFFAGTTTTIQPTFFSTINAECETDCVYSPPLATWLEDAILRRTVCNQCSGSLMPNFDGSRSACDPALLHSSTGKPRCLELSTTDGSDQDEDEGDEDESDGDEDEDEED